MQSWDLTHFLQAMPIYINDAYFHYIECGMANLLKESWIIKRYMYINLRMNKWYKIKINIVFF